MAFFPSPRMKAISAALLRRFRDSIALVILRLFTAAVLFASFFPAMMTIVDVVPLLLRVEHNAIFPPQVYVLIFSCSLVGAIVWIRRSSTPPSANAAPKPLLHRAMMWCARGPQILGSFWIQFVEDIAGAPGDPRVLSLFKRYDNRRLSSGHGSICSALVVSMNFIPMSFIAFGLILLAFAGIFGALILSIPCALLTASSFTPFLAARGWLSNTADRLAAEGSADLAASEASLLQNSVPAQPKASKPHRI